MMTGAIEPSTDDASKPPVITVRSLCRDFHTAAGVVNAVRDVSFDVVPGEVFGLLGANGAGKTTTLRMIMGLLPPTSGEVRVAGVSVAEDPETVKRSLALVSASSGLYQWLTPREIMQYFADLYDVPEDEAEARINELADLFELRSFVDRRCAGLSTGQQQRVNLARSLIHDPPVIMMDEPTRGLDIVGSKRIFDFTDHLRSEGRAVIICTHRLDEAERLCSRFALVHHGQLKRIGTLDQLTSETGHDRLTDMFLDLLAEGDAATARHEVTDGSAEDPAYSRSGE